MLVTMAAGTLHTIGHGTRPIEEFLEMLRAAAIETVVDVRAFPASRTNPQFNKDTLAESLRVAGIAYEHWPSLGGRRRGLGAQSPNTGWENASFRAYADYMMTPEFWAALDALLAQARERPTTVMCSETLWWRCHRRMIADAAVARRATVLHLMKPFSVSAHVLSPPARIIADRVVYTPSGD